MEQCPTVPTTKMVGVKEVDSPADPTARPAGAIMSEAMHAYEAYLRNALEACITARVAKGYKTSAATYIQRSKENLDAALKAFPNWAAQSDPEARSLHMTDIARALNEQERLRKALEELAARIEKHGVLIGMDDAANGWPLLQIADEARRAAART